MSNNERVKMGSGDMEKAIENYRNQGTPSSDNGKKRYSFEEVRQQKIENAMLKALESEDSGDWSEMMKWVKEVTQLRMMPQIMGSMLTMDFNGVGNGKTQDNDLQRRLDEMERRHEREKEEWRREKERMEQDEKIKGLSAKIDRLAEAWEKGSKKTEDDPILTELKAARKEISDMKKKERDEYDEAWKSEVVGRIESLRDEQREMSKYDRNTDSIDDFLARAEKMDAQKQKLGKILGLSAEQQEKMSPQDMIDFGMKKIPEGAKAFKTVKDLFNPQDYQDDVPPDDQVPAREVSGPSNIIDPEIQAFMDSMKVRSDGAVVDPKGGTWSNPDGSLMTKKDLEIYSKTAPGVIRDMIYQFSKGDEITQPKHTEEPKPKPKADNVQESNEDNGDNEQLTQNPEAEQKPVQNDSDYNPVIENINEYLSKGIETKDDQGNTYFVDKDGVSFKQDDGRFMTKADLQAEADKNPESFWSDVNQIRDSILTQMRQSAAEKEIQDAEGDDNSGEDKTE